jgi:nuclear transport factor 2 (NTF2) superfamily protein
VRRLICADERERLTPSRMSDRRFHPSPAQLQSRKSAWHEDGWNSCDPELVSLAYSTESYWRNRAEFVQGGPRSSHS